MLCINETTVGHTNENSNPLMDISPNTKEELNEETVSEIEKKDFYSKLVFINDIQ